MANAITIFRMAAGIVLLFCPVFSPAFYMFYIMAGLSDMLDGFVARKTNTAGRFGAKLDTMADYVFVIVCLIKLLPVIRIPIWLYVWIGIIAFIKVINIISGFAVQKTFMARAENVCGRPFGDEQSNRPSAVSIAADDSCFPVEILCDCRLCCSNIRRNSGRPFDQDKGTRW